MKTIEIIFTVGAPGSGKSTWAEKEALKPGTVVVTMDDLRSMIVGGKYRYSKHREKLIGDLQISNILTLMSDEQTSRVIVADTNLNDGRRSRIIERAFEHSKVLNCHVVFTEKPFDVSWVELEKRNLVRGEKAVPKPVLRMFYEKMQKYLGKHKSYTQNPALPKAVIFDIDGTIAKMGGRSPYNLDECWKDSVNTWVEDILKLYRKNGHKIILLSGRHSGKDGKESCYREMTVNWLSKNHIPYDAFFMRRWNDTRKDDIIKEEIFWNELADNYNIVAAFDDRDRVVEMWRRIGVKCAQVDFGEF